ncbi:hypothetical protein ABIB51_001167 [Arthrobacter sp. UYCu712]
MKPSRYRRPGARAGDRRDPVTALLVLTAAAVLCLSAVMAPSSSAGFLASVQNTVNKTGTASYFTCNDAVLADASSAVFGYKLAETTGSTTAADFTPTPINGTYRGSMTSDTTTARACPRDPGGTYTLNGSTSYVSTPTLRAGPNTFSVEIWFKTTTAGGKLIGFGNAQTGPSSSYDRHLYMSDTGRIVFGVYAGAVKTITGPLPYNDGAWHHAVATLSAAGMNLYLDGQKVAADPTTTTAQAYNGYWRIGYDNLAGLAPTQPTNFFFKGSLRFAAAYTTALTPAQITTHYNAGR